MISDKFSIKSPEKAFMFEQMSREIDDYEDMEELKTVTEEVMGVVGNECENLTKRIEERLGVVERVEHKSEYYEQKQTTEENVSFHIHQD